MTRFPASGLGIQMSSSAYRINLPRGTFGGYDPVLDLYQSGATKPPIFRCRQARERYGWDGQVFSIGLDEWEAVSVPEINAQYFEVNVESNQHSYRFTRERAVEYGGPCETDNGDRYLLQMEAVLVYDAEARKIVADISLGKIKKLEIA